jgi:hypothetical protein
LSSPVRKLRDDLGGGPRQPSWTGREGELLLAAVNNRSWNITGYNLDPVVAYSLASCARLAVADELRIKAEPEFQRWWRKYVAALGNNLAADFRQRAELWEREDDYDCGKNATALVDWDEFLIREAAESSRLSGHCTGLPRLDAELRGLRGMVLLGGDPWRGKSALGQHMFRSALAADPGLAVLHYSFDMSKQVVLSRLRAAEAGLSRRDMRGSLSSDQVQAVAEADTQLRGIVLPRLAIHEWNDRESFDWKTNVPGPLTAAAMVRHRQALLNSAGASRCLVFVDYLQKLRAPSGDPAGTVAASAAELAADLDRLQVLQQYQRMTTSAANPDGDAILVISEVRKSEAGKRELGLEDIRGHTRIGYTADTVMVLETADGQSPPGVARLNLRVVKSRDAEQVRVPLLFHYLTYRFTEETDETPTVRAVSPGLSPAGSGGHARDPLAGRR